MGTGIVACRYKTAVRVAAEQLVVMPVPVQLIVRPTELAIRKVVESAASKMVSENDTWLARRSQLLADARMAAYQSDPSRRAQLVLGDPKEQDAAADSSAADDGHRLRRWNAGSSAETSIQNHLRTGARVMIMTREQ